MSNVTPLPGTEFIEPKIRIIRRPESWEGNVPSDLTARVFVTIGAAETHVTIIDDEGACLSAWTAIFGWSFLFGLPLDCKSGRVFLEETEAVARALHGKMRIYGEETDTGEWVKLAVSHLTFSIEKILDQTIGSGVWLDGIVLAAPPWFQTLLAAAPHIRPHVLREIRDA